MNPEALARADDPETSKEAARSVAGIVSELCEWAARCVRQSPGKTQRELGAIYCPTDPRRIGRRLAECEALGVVRRGEPRPCSVSGRRAETWWPANQE